MDKLIERINQIGDLISQHQHSIFLLELEMMISKTRSNTVIDEKMKQGVYSGIN